MTLMTKKKFWNDSKQKLMKVASLEVLWEKNLFRIRKRAMDEIAPTAWYMVNGPYIMWHLSKGLFDICRIKT